MKKKTSNVKGTPAVAVQRSVRPSCGLLLNLSGERFTLAALAILAGDKTLGATKEQVMLECQRRYYSA